MTRPPCPHTHRASVRSAGRQRAAGDETLGVLSHSAFRRC